MESNATLSKVKESDEDLTPLQKLDKMDPSIINQIRLYKSELLLLQEINNILNSGASPEKVFKTIVGGLRTLYNYDSVAIHMLTDDKRHLVVKSYSADSSVAEKLEKITGLTVKGYKVPIYEGSLFDKIIEKREPIITDDIRWILKSYSDQKSLQNLAKTVSKLTKAKWGIGVPLRVGDKVEGIIGCGSKERLTPDDAQRLAIFGAQAGLVIERHQMYKNLQKKVEKQTRELFESEEKYRSLVETAVDALISLNDDMTISLWNNAAEKMFGYMKEEAIGSPIDIIIPEKLRELYKSSVERFRKAGKPRILSKAIELEAVRGDGSLFPIEVSLSTKKREDGLTYTAIIRDITERKKAEDAIKQSKEFNEIVLNSMNDALSIIDINDFTIIDANQVFLKKLGFKREEVIGKTCYKITHRRDSRCKPPDDVCPLVNTVKTGKYASAEHVHYTKDGKITHAEVSTSPIKDEKGEVQQVVHIARDITKRKRTEKMLEKAYEDLKVADKLKDEFLQNVSHELRTPITVMLSTNRVVKDNVTDKKLNEILELNEKSTWRLNRLVGSLLDYASIEQGTKKVKNEEVDVEGIINEIIENVKDFAKIKGVTMFFEKSNDLSNVLGDRDSVYTIVNNLINNAVKFNREGGSVTVRGCNGGDFVKVTVEDTGIGISKKDMFRVFDKFYQVDGTTKRKYGGTGIGLALTKKLVELQGGTIFVESIEGKGSSFKLSLPLMAS